MTVVGIKLNLDLRFPPALGMTEVGSSESKNSLMLELSLMQTIITNSVEETLKLGHDFGAKLKGGEVIEFIGDLGAGKTSFMRGLAEGLHSKDSVSSPTFTISNIYTTSRHPEPIKESAEHSEEFITIHHFDFYRLPEPGLISEQLKEAIEDPSSIACVEWAESVHGILPKSRITIQITALDEESREFKFSSKFNF